jgi:predicted nucleic acid-binding protein
VTAVSNASPLINLARIGRLDLLHQLYGELMMIIVDPMGTENRSQRRADEDH